jgi:hypothetical protein
MPFDKEAEENEWERGIELIFQSGKPKSSDDLSLGPIRFTLAL